MAMFEDWVASCDVGMRKPEPEIYQLVLERAGAKPSEAIFVDDREEMVEGAQAVGMRALHFRGLETFVQDLQTIGINV
jgi:HAD superfamily hydrolase (TIGR01509 family)